MSDNGCAVEICDAEHTHECGKRWGDVDWIVCTLPLGHDGDHAMPSPDDDGIVSWVDQPDLCAHPGGHINVRDEMICDACGENVGRA